MDDTKFETKLKERDNNRHALSLSFIHEENKFAKRL